MTRQRPVWQNALNHACAQHGLPRFLPLLQAQSDQEIEHYACRPAKFQVVLDHFAGTSNFHQGSTRRILIPAFLHSVNNGTKTSPERVRLAAGRLRAASPRHRRQMARHAHHRRRAQSLGSGTVSPHRRSSVGFQSERLWNRQATADALRRGEVRSKEYIDGRTTIGRQRPAPHLPAPPSQRLRGGTVSLF